MASTAFGLCRARRVCVALIVLAAGPLPACSRPPSPVSPSTVESPTPAVPSCTFSVPADQTRHDADAAGAAFTVAVRASDANCSWTAASQASFLVADQTGGQGTASVDVVVAKNSGPARTGELQVAGQSILVDQRAADAPAPCSFTVSPIEIDVPGAGDSAEITVAGGSASCSWTATTDASFVRIRSAVPQAGNGTLRVDVDGNDGAARVGSLTVAGTLVTIHQAGSTACVQNVSVTPATIDAAGGNATVRVQAADTCEWTVTSSSDFAQLPASASGSGNGTVALTAAANSSTSSRTARLTAGGREATLTQSGAPAPPQPPSPPPPPPPQPLPMPGPGAESLFQYASDGGDYIGMGGSGTMTAATASIDGSSEDNHRTVRATIVPKGAVVPWLVTFSAPAGQTLAPGLYRECHEGHREWDGPGAGHHGSGAWLQYPDRSVQGLCG